ncbi:hypothetical protein H257_02208 [Aphanomyces astaci]|uniref:EF-hand domain-containing protein n=1 Tax=Aphanomyces astaci TaxID=112090 RepID=W4H5G9_APHAT|nr:hypothetical protein H257_02208 [Aphanomyces astaci]ETV87250.1 hypothetical protein H257_02208 [Aphanomyces astaci]|eukprot:XP_009824049.1 hypothetical protein H257_02208 [Aphanomyces astaci]
MLAAGPFLLCMGAVVVVVIAMKVCFRALVHAVHDHAAFRDLVHNVTGELTVVGCIYLVVKLCLVVGIVAHDSAAFSALDAADLVVFSITLSLAIHVFLVLLCLRSRNKVMDVLFLRSPMDVLTAAAASLVRARHRSSLAQLYAARHHTRQLHLKALEHYFLGLYDLPPCFSFAAYIRAIQTRHCVTHILQIDACTWLVLLFQLCLIFPWDLLPPNDDNSVLPDSLCIFAAFTAVLTISALTLHVYLAHALNSLFQHVVGKQGEAMEAVRRLTSQQVYAVVEDAVNVEGDNPSAAYWCPDKQGQQRSATQCATWSGTALHPRTIQRCVRLVVVTNALLVALLWTVVVPTAHVRGGVWIALALSIPLGVNLLVLAAEVVHNAAIIQGVWYVDRETFRDAIERTEEMEMLKMHVISQMQVYMWEHRLSPQDLVVLVRDVAGSSDSFVHVHVLRGILQSIFHLHVTKHKLKTLLQLTCSMKSGSRFNIMDLIALLDAQGHHGSGADLEFFL